MPLDNSAAQNAQSLLNGIDYDALIGGPLQAAVRAQAMAARSTWEFIQQVGLQKDPTNGQTSAVNVSFLYQKDGEMVKLIVPILTIVPIPLILIDDVSIQFKANINASASSTTEEAQSEAIAGELEATGKVGWGPFSLQARMKASYSSKKDSKATQDSRYSVEYTQDVSVHASQAGVPAGLATVLNILSNAATGASRGGDLKVSPPIVLLNAENTAAKQSLQVKLADSNGLNVRGATVTFALPKDADKALSITTPLGKKIDITSGTFDLETGDDGTAGLLIAVEPNATGVPIDGILEMKISAPVDKSKKEFTLPLKLTGVPGSLAPDASSIDIKAGQKGDATFTAKRSDGSAASSVDVTATIPSQPAGLSATTLTVKTDTSGKAKFTFDVAAGTANGDQWPVSCKASIDGIEVHATVEVKVVP
jgi:hypothetical protein